MYQFTGRIKWLYHIKRSLLLYAQVLTMPATVFFATKHVCFPKQTQSTISINFVRIKVRLKKKIKEKINTDHNGFSHPSEAQSRVEKGTINLRVYTDGGIDGGGRESAVTARPLKNMTQMTNGQNAGRIIGNRQETKQDSDGMIWFGPRHVDNYVCVWLAQRAHNGIRMMMMMMSAAGRKTHWWIWSAPCPRDLNGKIQRAGRIVKIVKLDQQFILPNNELRRLDSATLSLCQSLLHINDCPSDSTLPSLYSISYGISVILTSIVSRVVVRDRNQIDKCRP